MGMLKWLLSFFSKPVEKKKVVARKPVKKAKIRVKK